jgi:tetrahydrodipicolinate N-succinyltransferase
MQHITLRPASAMRKSVLWIQAAVIASVGLVPVLMVNSANAATEDLLNREARVTNAIPSTAFNITFEFDTTVHADTTVSVQGAEFEFVDDPLALYGAAIPSNVPVLTSATLAGEAGWLTTNEATAFGTLVNEDGDNYSGGNTPLNQLTVIRTDTDDQEGLTDASVSFNGLTHNAQANTTFYVRMRLYSDTARTAGNLVWQGTVAQSTSQTLNVSARVQERLEFCVGATTTNDATADKTETPAGAELRDSTNSNDILDCGDVDGTNVNLGVVDNSGVNVSPVSAVNGGNATNGLAMVNTNAVNGTVISYAAIGDGSANGEGRLKVDGVNCSTSSPTSLTDQCFNSIGATQDTIGTGIEEFGMTIGGVNCASNGGVGYTCDYSTGDTNLVPQAQYIGAAGDAFGTSNGFAWQEDGTYTNIASSGASTIKVLEDEALILVFGATASATTPTGTYDVDIDFVATPTF